MKYQERKKIENFILSQASWRKTLKRFPSQSIPLQSSLYFFSNILHVRLTTFLLFFLSLPAREQCRICVMCKHNFSLGYDFTIPCEPPTHILRNLFLKTLNSCVAFFCGIFCNMLQRNKLSLLPALCYQILFCVFMQSDNFIIK